MSKIPQLIIRTVLRRSRLLASASQRVSRFRVFERHSWLKSFFDELRPEIVTPKKDAPPEEVTAQAADEKDPSAVEAELSSSLYTDLERISMPGTQLCMKGLVKDSRQRVVIKHYQDVLKHHLPLSKRRAFKDLVRLSQNDNQPEEDLRIIWPIDVIEDTQQNDSDSYYLVFQTLTEGETGITLAQQLAKLEESWSCAQIRRVIEQILQSLRHVNHHPIRLASEQRQVGLSHGNLTLESVICVERSGSTFFYLDDFAVWAAPLKDENEFYSSITVEKDLTDLGKIGQRLVQHQLEIRKPLNSESQALTDDALNTFLDRLGKELKNTDSAWHEWLDLPPLAVSASDKRFQREEERASATNKVRWLWIGGWVLLAFLAAGGWWWLQLGQREVAVLPERLDDVQSLEGDFTYAAVTNSRWSRIVEQSLFRGQTRSVNQSVKNTHGGFFKQVNNEADIKQGFLREKSSVQEAIQSVEDSITEPLISSERVDFAVVPLVNGTQLPSTLGYEIIAYDGLAIVVPFSYESRKGGLAKKWAGAISLEEIYDRFTQKQDITGNVHVTMENQEIFNQKIFSEERPERDFGEHATVYLSDSNGKVSGTDHMLRGMLKRFEKAKDRHSYIIGFSSLSSVIKQCSVYPLAVSAPGKAAVSPLVMQSGKAISPDTDLCDDKTLYQPNFEAFRRDRYPLAYPIAVVYPQDNSRAAAGQKFAEMMLTTEVQQLLLEAGLVPVVDPFELAGKEVISSQDSSK